MITIYLSILTSLLGLRHDFHASISTVEYKNQQLQVSIKVFTEDLEDHLSDASGQAVYLAENGSAQTDSLISLWLNSNFQLQHPKAARQNYLGKEVEVDLTFLYLEIPLAEKPKSLRVRNSLFFDRFDDQSNIVNIQVGDQLESAFLSPDQPEQTLYFD